MTVMATTYARVWDALAPTTGEADALQRRSEQLHAIQQRAAANKWTTEELARHLQLSTEEAAAVLEGHLDKFTEDRLAAIVAANQQ
ncbi:Uncharacterized conserved small protein [Mycobacteroides abscessus]|uniref:Uncharacterized conserved small protein n=2 Tax=Mycobacteroides abscessus TaxID=36809 RepID=A0A0U0ZTV3_9MYCO|nr:Uncharacterized conserved small protein [Mycobacteroides abscessus]